MNKALKILLAADSINLLAAAMLGPIYAVFVEEVGGDILIAGFSFAMFAFVMGSVILLVSKVEDRLLREKKLWLIAGYFVIAAGFSSYLFVQTVFHLFFVQVLLGLGRAILAPAFDGLYSKHLSKGRFASGWGFWEAANQYSAAGGAIIGATIVSLFGFQVLFIVMAFLSFLSGVVIFLSPRKIL